MLRIGDFSTRFWSSQQVADTKYIEDVIGFQFKSIRMTIKIRKIRNDKNFVDVKLFYDKSPTNYRDLEIFKILFKNGFFEYSRLISGKFVIKDY